MTTIILQRFANREYRLTRQSIVSPGKSKGDKYAERQSEKYAQAVLDTYVLDQNFNSQLMCASPEEGGRISRMSHSDIKRGIRSLDIIDEFQQNAGSRKRGGWGFLAKPTSFTRNARHRLLEAGAIVDMDCGKDAYEVTLTLPASTQEAFRTLAEYSGWIVNRLLREVTRSKCSYWFYVWEFQKRGALHLHLLFAGLGERTKRVAQSVEYQWWELLWELSTVTGVDLFRKSTQKTWKYEPSRWQSHCAPIAKSVAAYFSKYAGKQSKGKRSQKQSTQFHCPSRWWGSSQTVKRRINSERAKYRLNVGGEVGRKLIEHLQTWLDQPGKIKSYNYQFDLGKSRNGTNLGGGDVCINYYDTQTFKRMQTWEKYVWEDVCMMARNADMTDADMGELDIIDNTQTPQMCYKHEKCATPPLPPHNQHSSTVSSDVLQGVLRRQPTLAIRAKLLQYLAGGEGENIAETPTEYVQGSLFDCSYGYTEVVGASTQHNPL